jgi:hypothetical protein
MMRDCLKSALHGYISLITNTIVASFVLVTWISFVAFSLIVRIFEIEKINLKGSLGNLSI